LFRARRETQAVNRQKRVEGGKRGALVAIDEGMILRKAFPERGGFLDQIGVVAGLRAVEGGLQQAVVANAMGAAVAFDLIGVDGQHFDRGQVVGHSASFL
jgi:hypothetical protein